MGSIRSITSTEEATIARRLIRSMPASRYEMQTLCRLAGVKVSRELPTAAVQCVQNPRLLINPDFVEKFCPRDEHLFLLVMHELWHIQLAHTRMYPRMTKLQNIALDAIINAGLMREFSGPEYRGFFDAVYPADKFPSCLLRPPEGWPDMPVYPKEVGPPGTVQMIKRLYPPGNSYFHSMPMYEEVLALLLKAGMKWTSDEVMLIGNHDSDPVYDPLMREFMQTISSKWEGMPGTNGGMDPKPRRRRYPINESTREMQRTFAVTLRNTLNPSRGEERRKSKSPVEAITSVGVIPNARDRLAPARKKLGLPQTLWAQNGNIKARMPQPASRAFVYLDVSGSMMQCLPYLLGLIAPHVAGGRAEVYQFSTTVRPILLDELRSGNMTTTGGTDINPVLEHLLSQPRRPTRVLLLTDGEVGSVRSDLIAPMSEYRPMFVAVLPFNGREHAALRTLNTQVVRLPRP